MSHSIFVLTFSGAVLPCQFLELCDPLKKPLPMYNFPLNDPFFDEKIISTVLRCKNDIGTLNRYSSFEIEHILSEKISIEFEKLNFNSPNYLHVKSISIDSPDTDFPRHAYGKSVSGLGMIAMGQPILKKRFVMKGSAEGTSIASKYLSRTFPQRMPFRFLKTNVLGRMIGRAVPYIGTALIVIDAIELLIETYVLEKNENGSDKVVFKGGHFGGGGASGMY